MIIRGTPMTLEYFRNLHLSVHFKSDPDLYTIYNWSLDFVSSSDDVEESHPWIVLQLLCVTLGLVHVGCNKLVLLDIWHYLAG